jgi:hypothetical protein
MDYKATLNLPKTDSPLRASPTRMEIEMLRHAMVTYDHTFFLRHHTIGGWII